MKNRFNIGCIVKVLVIVGIIMALMLLVITCSGGSCIQKIDKSLPSLNDAPWIVTTPSHQYYSQNATQTKTGVTIINWYEQSKGKWVLHKGQLELPFNVYGKIEINRR